MDNVGILAISTLILVILYGMAVVQATLYFGRFRQKDPRAIQIVVLLVCVLAFVQLIFMCTSLYSFTIIHFLAPPNTVRIPQALVLAVFVGSITHPLIQATLTFRMWKLGWTQGCPCTSRFVAPICWTISASILGLTMFLSLKAIFAVQDKASLIGYIEDNVWAMFSVLLATACVDLVTSISLCYVLYSSRREVLRGTVKLLDKLIFWTIPTGIVTSVTAVLIIVAFKIARDSFLWLSLLIILTDLYVNTLLALLNCRWELRDLDDDMTITTLVLPNSRAQSLHGGGIPVPQLRRQLRTVASRDTLMTTLRGYRNTASNNTYSTHIYSSADQATTATTTMESTGIHLISDRPNCLALTATRTHLRSASLSHQPERENFEMIPLRRPQSAQVSLAV